MSRLQICRRLKTSFASSFHVLSSRKEGVTSSAPSPPRWCPELSQDLINAAIVLNENNPQPIKVNEYGLGEHKRSLVIDPGGAAGRMLGRAPVSHRPPLVLVTVSHKRPPRCESNLEGSSPATLGVSDSP